MARHRKLLLMDGVLTNRRFMLKGNRLMFKSKIAIAEEHKHYNQWYEIAVIPPDLKDIPGIHDALARAFHAKGYRPLTEEEVRASALHQAVTG
jgi:hypothetical protein